MSNSYKKYTRNPAWGVAKQRKLDAEIDSENSIKFSYAEQALIASQMRKLMNNIHKHNIDGVEVLADGRVSEDEKRKRFQRIVSLAIVQQSQQAVNLLQQYQIDVTNKQTRQIVEEQMQRQIANSVAI